MAPEMLSFDDFLAAQGATDSLFAEKNQATSSSSRQGGAPVPPVPTPRVVAHGAQGRVVVYSDGSSRGNPGRGGYGAVVLYQNAAGQNHRLELSGGYERTTNNRMELLGAIAALESLPASCAVELHTDSQYVCNAFNNNWISGWKKRGWKNAQKKPVANRDLWERLIAAVAPHRVTFMWVKGHAGHTLNERCDELATSAADGNSAPLLQDPGYGC